MNKVIPILCIDLKKNRIRIHKQTLHLLGDPEYIQLLVNPQSGTIAIRRSFSEDYLAHRIKAEHLTDGNSYELYSRELIQTLRTLNTNYENNKSYRIYGNFNTKSNVACFDMCNMKEVSS